MRGKAMTALVSCCALTLTTSAALAGHPGWKHHHHRHHGHHAEYEYARVIHVEPILRHVRVSVPHRECWTETRHEYVEHVPQSGHAAHRGAAGSMILGGVIGAALGNQIGSGDGRRAATVAGAIIGSAIGHDVAMRRSAQAGQPTHVYREVRPYEVERCSVSYHETHEERIDGYRVTYLFNGREHTTELPYDPGDRIRIRVDVHPDDCH